MPPFVSKKSLLDNDSSQVDDDGENLCGTIRCSHVAAFSGTSALQSYYMGVSRAQSTEQ
jgi:hypothetical protein